MVQDTVLADSGQLDQKYHESKAKHATQSQLVWYQTCTISRNVPDQSEFMQAGQLTL